MIHAVEKTRAGSNPKAGHYSVQKERSQALFFQPKLAVGPTDDVYEREADAVADQVMHVHDNEQIQTKISSINIQRKCAACEEEEHVQRKDDDGYAEQSEAPLIVADALGSSGNPLDNNSRSFMENRFGYDFSKVRVHTDTVAAKSAQSINALAYTSGNSIVFNKNQYSPGTESGKKLLAHELTHVVQQHSVGQIQRQHVHEETATSRPTLGRCRPVQDDLRPTATWATLQAGYQARCGTATSRAGDIAGGIWGDLSSGRMPRIRGGAPGARDSVDCVCAHGGPRTVAIAAMARVIAAGPLAAQMFWHFLGASGTDRTIDVADMIARSSGVRSKIHRSMRRGGREGTTRIEQSDYGIDDFQFAYGAIDCVQWQVDRTEPRRWRSTPSTPVTVSMLDYYEFHPARRAASQCAHAACVELVDRGQARNFWTRGTATTTLGVLSS